MTEVLENVGRPSLSLSFSESPFLFPPRTSIPQTHLNIVLIHSGNTSKLFNASSKFPSATHESLLDASFMNSVEIDDGIRSKRGSSW